MKLNDFSERMSEFVQSRLDGAIRDLAVYASLYGINSRDYREAVERSLRHYYHFGYSQGVLDQQLGNAMPPYIKECEVQE